MDEVDACPTHCQEKCVAAASAALNSGKSVIVDNTNAGALLLSFVFFFFLVAHADVRDLKFRSGHAQAVHKHGELTG